MTIFDVIKSVAFTKTKVELNTEFEAVFSSFMLNRWLSFHSKEVALFVNETTNHTVPGQTKADQYQYYHNILPKVKFKKISYIKKAKSVDTKAEKNITYTPEFSSKREEQNKVDFMKEYDNI